jgi:alkylation response protein AidB-like acyl-CoA dehydrogenase
MLRAQSSRLRLSQGTPAMSSDVLRDSLRRLLSRYWPLRQSAQLSRSEAALTQAWRELSELGFGRLGAPDAGGLLDALPLIRDLGAANCAAHVLEAVVLNSALGSLEPDWLPQIHTGEVIPAVCAESTVAIASIDPTDPGRCKLRGTIDLIDAVAATHIALIVRRADGSAALAWTELRHSSVSMRDQTFLSESRLAQIEFQDTPSRITPLHNRIVDRLIGVWRLCLCARATGAAFCELEEVIEYAKQRRQFGAPIGSFQAIQHKLANVRIALEGARLTQDMAAAALDGGTHDWMFRTDVAIATADPNLRQCALEMLHTFGATGYSEEHSASRHFRRIHADIARAGGDRSRAKLCEALMVSADAVIPNPDLGEAAERFRSEVRNWLSQSWSETEQARERARAQPDKGLDKQFSRKLGQKGWLALTWPSQYGGMGRTGFELLALIQETSRVSAPTLSHLAAAYLVAPALLAFGSEAQKSEFLPRIARGELCISLGYSEPEAGSDLASLRTRADREGDEYVINGQKMWGSTTDKADYVWLAARTDSQVAKHAGISIFLIPLNTPGITIRPHLGLHGKTFSTQMFDNVRVPHQALVGAVNQGWKIITGALADERILLASGVGEVSAAFTNLVKWLRLRAPLDHLAQNRIGSLAADICVANALLLRTVSQDQPGTAAHVAAAVAKTYASELMERFAELSVELAGARALLSDGEPGSILDGELDRLLRLGPMHVIGGGTNEIQRSLIALRGLDLPR